MRRRPLSALFGAFLLLLTASCGRACSKDDASGSAPRASTSAPQNASAATSASASAKTKLDAGSLVDLLWMTNAKVAVSSRVSNPRDVPLHIADHKPETAWNGKTGDLAGAWIAFRVPKDAHVDHILISAGFDKKTDKEDLFLANHRITRLRLTHDGAKMRDVDLDPAVRTPQRIDVGASGGDYKLEVLAVAAGSHAGWRELTVSELAVLGTSTRMRARDRVGPPIVVVGGLDVTEEPYTEAQGRSYEEACAKAVEDEALAVADVVPYLPEDQKKESAATCTAPSTTTKGRGGFLETAHVAFANASVGFGRPHFDGEVLAFKTAKQTVVTSIRLSGHQTTVNPVTDYKVIEEKWAGHELIVDVEGVTTTWEDGKVDEDDPTVDHGPWQHKQLLHTVCDGDRLSCTTTSTMTPLVSLAKDAGK